MKPMPPVVAEFIQRLLTENPEFFKWIQRVSAVIAVVAFIPDLLAYLEIPTPNWLDILHDKAIKIGALTAIIMAQLPNKSANDKV